MRRSGNRIRGLAIVAALATGGLGLVRGAAAATINGFANFTLNSNGNGGGGLNTPTDTQLTLTTLNNTGHHDFEVNSAIYNVGTVPIGTFSTSFVYTMTPGTGDADDPADGVTFVIENDPAGVNAIGGEGGGLGYGDADGEHAAISNSVAVELDIFNGNGHGTGTNLATDGGWGNYNATGSVNLASGDPILVQLSYDGTTLSETLTDQDNTALTYSTSYSVNIPSVVGGSSAWVGFTGSDGNGSSTQVITQFSFSNSVATPLPPAAWSGLVLLGGLGVVHAVRRKSA